MKKIFINQRIIESLGLNEREARILDFLLGQQMGKTTMKIARAVGVPRSTAVYILNKFLKRRLVVRDESLLFGKCPVWRYKRGLEKLHHSGLR
jgi:predicted transcriptional regulator